MNTTALDTQELKADPNVLVLCMTAVIIVGFLIIGIDVAVEQVYNGKKKELKNRLARKTKKLAELRSVLRDIESSQQSDIQRTEQEISQIKATMQELQYRHQQ